MALTIMIFFERGERDFGRLAGMAVKRELFLLSPTLSIHTSRIEHEVHTHIAQTAQVIGTDLTKNWTANSNVRIATQFILNARDHLTLSLLQARLMDPKLPIAAGS